jgi:ssDNA thymidine ADP-ribosyltransferase DarT-like protein
MSDPEAIRAEAELRSISRLAHFTPLRNLVHIATSNDGLLSTQALTQEERSAFNPQDLKRLDGFPDHISCSIEYPNAYYLRRKRKDARGEKRIFPDWVCLLIASGHLWRDSTLLCPHNAAGRRGVNVGAGIECFKSLFADQVDAPQGVWTRESQPTCCPTDAQAEVLVHRQIPPGDILGIAVESAAQAGDTYAVLRQLEAPVEELPILICPDFYSPTGLALGLRAGRRPVEQDWHPEVHAGGEADN